MNKGILIVISSPSGGGKGTILAEVLKKSKNMKYSVSATTREPREGEVDGQHYHFLDKNEFVDLIENAKMLEHAVFCDNYYGTPKEPVVKALEEGKDVVLEIEVQGGKQVKSIMPECVSVFIAPPSLEVLEDRLRGRGTEDEPTIQKRLKRAKIEMKSVLEYDYLVVNDTVEQAVCDVMSIIRAEKLKTNRD